MEGVYGEQQESAGADDDEFGYSGANLYFLAINLQEIRTVKWLDINDPELNSGAAFMISHISINWPPAAQRSADMQRPIFDLSAKQA